jgi:hypothetical protein
MPPPLSCAAQSELTQRLTAEMQQLEQSARREISCLGDVIAQLE